MRRILRLSGRTVVGTLAFIGLRSILLDRNERDHGSKPANSA